MKKIISVFLVAATCFALCACQNTPSVTIENLSGKWATSIPGLEESLTINTNSTFDRGDDKGMVTISEDSFVTENRLGSKTTYYIHDNYIYKPTHPFEKDDEYGFPFSPDENGRTEQSFCINASNFTLTQKDGYTHCSIDFHQDGTYVMKFGWFSVNHFGGANVDKTLKGTYSYQDNIITLTNGTETYPLIVGEENQIYYIVYEKQ